jgi:hypothetical protein
VDKLRLTRTIEGAYWRRCLRVLYGIRIDIILWVESEFNKPGRRRGQVYASLRMIDIGKLTLGVQE